GATDHAGGVVPRLSGAARGSPTTATGPASLAAAAEFRREAPGAAATPNSSPVRSCRQERAAAGRDGVAALVGGPARRCGLSPLRRRLESGGFPRPAATLDGLPEGDARDRARRPLNHVDRPGYGVPAPGGRGSQHGGLSGVLTLCPDQGRQRRTREPGV